MKRNYKLNLFAALVVAGLSVGYVNALPTNGSSVTMNIQESENWVEVKNENGIKTFMTNHELNGKTYLKIRFENLTGNDVQLVWSLTNKEGKTLINEQMNKVGSNQSVDFMDATMPVLINYGETITDFSIAINPQ